MGFLKSVMKRIFMPFQKVFGWFKRASIKKKIFIIVVAVILILIIGSQFASNGSNGYVFEEVKRQSITEVVAESGNVVTAGKTDVYSPSQGIVEELYIKNGDIVTIDQPLFKVKSTATEDEKAAAYADLAAAQSALKTAHQTKISLQSALETARIAVLDAQQDVDDLNDNRNNGRDNPATGDKYTQLEIDSIEASLKQERLDFDTAEKKYVEAGIAINSAQAALTKASLAHESTKDRVIKSPSIGTVSNLAISLGSSVTPQTTTILGESSTPVLTIANFSSNQIVLEVNESDISKLQVGQKATIDPDALDNKTYNGIVTKVDDIGMDDDGVIVYNAYIEITNSDDQLKSGMTVDVDIVTSEIENVLTVPNAAVKPYQGGRAVRVLDDQGEIEFIPVVTGVKGETLTQIVEGLSEGQEIIVSLTNENIERSGGLGF